MTVYPLESLQPMLTRNDARVQGELARLDPSLKAAAAAKDAREAAAKAAFQTFVDAASTDPLHGALRFAARQARIDVATATADYQYLLDQRAEVMDGELPYRDLPAPVAESQTDAQGSFALELPTGGRYVVAARLSQTGVTGTHTRYWLVRVALENGSEKSIALTESNVASADSADSLLRTAN